MDFSFTTDSNWIRQREHHWSLIENQFSDTSRKKIEGIRKYFMTGEFPREVNLGASYIITLFPTVDVTAIEYCVRNYVDAKNVDLLSMYVLFCSSNSMYHCLPWISLEESVDLFQAAFGSVYEQDRCFPFLLNGESEKRIIPLSASYLFGLFTEPYFWFDRPNEKPPMGCVLLEYAFSTFSFVDEYLFDTTLHDMSVVVGQGLVAVRPEQKRLRHVLKAFVSPLPELLAGTYGSIWKNYFDNGRERMESLICYPGELKQLWESIKEGKAP